MSRLYADGSTEFVCQKPLGAKHLPTAEPQSRRYSRKCFAPTPRRGHGPNVLWSDLVVFQVSSYTKEQLLVSSLPHEERRMAKKQSAVQLTPAERHELEMVVTRGKKSAREITRARTLLLAQDGRRVTAIAQTLGVSRGTLYNVVKRYKRKKTRTPLVEVLKDEPRSGRPFKLGTRVEAKVTMLACSDPPAGRSRWTLHLLADKLVT